MYISRLYGMFGALISGIVVIAVLSLCPTVAIAAEKISFKEDIFPIIQFRCMECHQPGGKGYEASGFDLRTYEGLMKGTRHGPMVLPGDPFMSNLNVLIEGRSDKKISMPFHGKKMTSCDRELFHDWVRQGALNN